MVFFWRVGLFFCGWFCDLFECQGSRAIKSWFFKSKSRLFPFFLSQSFFPISGHCLRQRPGLHKHSRHKWKQKKASPSCTHASLLPPPITFFLLSSFFPQVSTCGGEGGLQTINNRYCGAHLNFFKVRECREKGGGGRDPEVRDKISFLSSSAQRQRPGLRLVFLW